MTDTLELVQACVADDEVRVSRHGGSELAADGILLDDIAEGVARAVVVEDYPGATRGSTVLALHRDRDGRPVHVLCAFAKATRTPAVLVTTYRPDSTRWSADFLKRTRP